MTSPVNDSPANHPTGETPTRAARVLAVLLCVWTAASVLAMPPNDSCGDAAPMVLGTTMVSLRDATLDGVASCDGEVVGDLPGLRDAWFYFTPMTDGPLALYVVDERDEPVSVAAYGGCPGTLLNEIRCGDGNGLVLNALAGEPILLRLAAPDTDPVLFSVTLEAAPQVAGDVFESDGHTPAVPTEVEWVNPHTQWVGSTSVADDGSFRLALPRPGTYFAAVRSQVYLPETFDDLPCGSLCDPPTGAPITVAAAEQIDDIDFRLDAWGRISGTVTDASNHQPLVDITLSAVDADGVEFTTRSDEAGHYSFVGLPPQTYTVSARHGNYLDLLYDDVPCSGFSCDPSLGAPLTLELNQHRQGIDFALRGLGRISGRITAADTGEPVKFAFVAAYGADGFSSHYISNEQGEYVIGGLPEGDYSVLVISDDTPFLSQLYPDIPCPLLDCDWLSGAPVAVALDSTATQIDFVLERGGTLRGTVLDRPSGDGVPGAFVYLLDLDGETVASVETGSTHPGQFILEGIAPGEYALAAFSRLHLGRVVGGGPCSRDFIDCDLDSGTRWTIGIGSVFNDIDAVVDGLGVIEGRLIDGATGSPLTEGVVKAWDESGHLATTALYTLDNTFRLEGLAPGSYTVSAEHVGYRTDVYPGVPQTPCVDDVCDPALGEVIAVDINHVVDIDFPLRRKAAIAGTVRAEDGAVVPFPQLQLWNASGDLVQSITGDAEGHYIAEGLDGGDYVLSSQMAEAGYRDEVYSGMLCNGSCSPASGTIIPLAEYDMVSGIDFTLTRLGVISGIVADRPWNIPIYRSSLTLYGADGSSRYATTSISEGRFEFAGVVSGTYYLVAGAYGFPELLFPDVPCPQGQCDLTSGTALVIDDNVLIGDLQVGLEMQQGIVGRVIDEATGLPVSEVQVQIYDDTGFAYAPRTDAQGYYREPLPLGTYYLKLDYRTSNYEGEEEAYDDVPCPRLDCDPRDVGMPVEVIDNQVVEGIDFEVTGHFCTPNRITLCLNDRRFEVRAKYRNSRGGLTWASTRSLTDDSGTFYFFDPDNLEIVVKVLNACVDPFDSFWVFAAGLTDLGVELTVVDTYTGLSRIYTNPDDQPYRPVRDTAAFATCHVPATASAAADASSLDIKTLSAMLEASLAEVRSDLPPADLASTPSKGISAKTASSSCATSDTALCLQQGRFRVEAQWETPDNRSGVAQAVPLTADSGYFWFFTGDNIEVMVKVLDGCVDPFDSFWVFAAGLTDVEVTLSVTDTLTGEMRQYVNGQGTAFSPIQDTAAFRTCPAAHPGTPLPD